MQDIRLIGNICPYRIVGEHHPGKEIHSILRRITKEIAHPFQPALFPKVTAGGM